MKIHCNISAFEKSFKDLEKEITRKMEGMVRKFTYTVSFTAIDNTPMGDSALYPSWYEMRKNDPNWQSYGLEPVEGFARGSWNVSMDGVLSMQQIYGKSSGEKAEAKIKSDMLEYKLGDTVMISNFGPYILNLENNYSDQTRGQGIIRPTIASVMRTYQYSLDDYYKAA